jgi:hypothetical protein
MLSSEEAKDSKTENHVITCVTTEVNDLLKPNRNFFPGSIRLNVTVTKKKIHIN